MFKRKTVPVKRVNEKERAMKKTMAKKYCKNARKTKIMLRDIALIHNNQSK